ncbi:MAG: phosphoribosylanthranilate isomerase [Methylocella sp.]
MSMLVKICGLNANDAIDAAIEAGADMVGFVVFDRSPRHVSLDQASSLGARVPSHAAKVLLTVDADDASLAAAIAALDPAFLQLHGAETPERVAAIRAAFGVKVIKAIGIGERADLDQIRRYDDIADMLLFDARPPPKASRPGGNGAGFDWSLLAGVMTKKPWLLAGGLDAGNVAEALRETGAAGVDVSSGVESAPGVKDKGKMATFVAAVRAGGREKLGLARASV